MQFRTKIVAFAVLLACGATVCASLLLTLARGIERGLESVALAEDQLTLYLVMENNVSDMFRLQIVEATAPSSQTLARFEATKQAVRDDVGKIRRVKQAEANLTNEALSAELLQLDQIEAVLDEIEFAFDQVSQAAVTQPLAALAPPLLTVFETLDIHLAPLVDLAVAGEVAKVVKARAEIVELSRRSVQAGIATGLLTLLAALFGTLLLLSSFMRPFRSLLEGASHLAEGDLSFRIPENGHDEMGRLSRDFNRMATQLERADSALRAKEEELQRRVAARTAELETANTQLAKQDETRRRFLADVSHELRTPITVMRGEAEVVLRDREAVLGDGAREALLSVVEQSEHMSRLVDDLLFVARRDAGEAPLKLSRVPLGEILKRTVAVAGQLAINSALVLNSTPGALATPIEVDRGRLHQLLMVLLDNALRYSPGGSPVTVEARCVKAEVIVAIRDSGIGIPSAELPHVFDRFMRGSNALPGGTGLGLPVARAIAEAHGGRLVIDSTEGQGTCVTLILPAVPEG